MAEESGNGIANEIVQAQFGEQAADTTQDLDNALHEQDAPPAPDQSTDGEVDNEGFNKRFAALSRKEKAIREKEQSWNSRQSEHDAMKAEIAALKAEKETPAETEPTMSLEQRLRRDPLKALEELGLGYDTLTNLAINDGNLTPDMQMKILQEDMQNKFKSEYGTKLEQLEQKLADKEAAEEESKYQDVINNFNAEISSHIQDNASSYELIEAFGAESLVYEVIAEHHKKSGKVLEIKEAAEAVESHLMKDAQKIQNVKKLSASIEPSREEPFKEFRQSPTLSNVQSAQTPKLADRKLTDDESKAAVAQLIKWD